MGISQPGADWESICSLLSVSQKLIWRVPASSHRTCDTENALVLQHLSPRHPHTPDSVVWLQPSACRAELSDLCKLFKCNRSFLTFSSITAHTNGVQRGAETHYPVVWGAFHALVAVHFVDTDLQMIAATDLNACPKDTHVWRVWFVFCCVLERARMCVCVDQQLISLLQSRFFSQQITRKVERLLSPQRSLQ